LIVFDVLDTFDIVILSFKSVISSYESPFSFVLDPPAPVPLFLMADSLFVVESTKTSFFFIFNFFYL